jgi:hypothetical protein
MEAIILESPLNNGKQGAERGLPAKAALSVGSDPQLAERPD